MSEDTLQPLVVISYARADGLEAATHLDNALPKYGFRTWRDEYGIDPAKDFTVEIEKAIRASDVVVACITPEIVKRDDSFVRRELNYALYHKKPVIVARFANVAPPINVFNHTWVDYFGRDQAEADRDLYTKLRMPREQLGSTKPQDDPFRDYVGWLYDQLVYFLDKSVIRLIDLKVVPSLNTRTINIFVPRYLPFEPQPDSDMSEPPNFDTFEAAFEYFNKRLLLLGDPGAGKSVTMMAFARNAAAARLADPSAPLPVFGIVAEWDAKNQTPIEAWLANDEHLNALPLPRVIENGKALLLLDGLDELGSAVVQDLNGEITEFDPRERFLELIPDNNCVVVSCRFRDYKKIRKGASLNDSIVLQPLDDEQIREYLADDLELLDAVKADSGLCEMVRTPLILSLFAFAYRDQEDRSELRDLRESPHRLRQAIFKRYVRERHRWELRRYQEQVSFPLDEIYDVLGYVAAEGMLNASGSIGHDQVLSLGDVERAFKWLGGDGNRAAEFVAFAERINLISVIDEAQKTFRFIHLLFLPHFASHERLVEVLGESDQARRTSTIDALGAIGDERAVRILVPLLIDDDEFVYERAFRVLSNIGKNQLNILIEMLNDDTEYRRRIIELLGFIGDERALPHLVNILNNADNDGDIRSSATNALGWIGGIDVFDILVTLLADPDSNVRSFAVLALGRMDNMQARSALGSALADEDYEVRRSVVTALGQIGDIQVIPMLVTALGDENGDVYNRALETLVTIGEPAVGELISALYDEENYIRHRVLETLATIGELAVSELVAVLREHDDTIRRSAADVLVRIGQPAVSALVAMLRDHDDAVRRSAADVLVRIGQPAVSELVAVLRDHDDAVRRSAADVLVRIGEPAISELVTVLRDHDDAIRHSAADVLVRIGEPAVSALVAMLRDHDDAVRRSTADVLVRIGEPAVSALVAMLRDHDDAVRRSAADVLVRIGSFAVPKLIVELSHPNGVVRRNAIDILVDIGEPAVPRLINELNTPDEVVWRSVIDTLVRIGPLSAQDLISLLGDEKNEIRHRAAVALWQIRDTRATPIIISALNDVDSEVRLNAYDALVILNNEERIVPDLIKILHIDDSTIQQNVANVLVEIGQSAVSALRATLANNDGRIEFRQNIAKILERIGGVQDVTELIDTLKQGDIATKRRAANELAQIGESAVSAVPALIDALEYQDSRVKAAAASALESIGTEEALDAVRRFYARSRHSKPTLLPPR